MSGGWPLLRRAPARMLHSGSIAGLILVSVALLAGLVAAGPLFGSATNAGGLARRLATIPGTTSASLRPVVRMTIADGPPAALEPQVTALVDDLPYLGATTTSLAGMSWQLDERGPVSYMLSGGLRLPSVLYFRTGAVAALQTASGTPGAPGLWLPAGAAKDLGVRPGSTLEVGRTFRYNIPGCGAPFNRVTGKVAAGGATKVKVAGTYRTAPDGRLPLGPYFSHLGPELPSDPGHCLTPALMLIGDRATIDTVIAAVGEQPVWTHTASLTAAGQTPAHLSRAAAAAARLRVQAQQPGTPVADLMSSAVPEFEFGDDLTAAQQHAGAGFQIDSGLPAIHQQAVADAAAAAQQGRRIAYAGGLLGLAAVIVAVRALAQRRRRETELLLGLGTPTRIVVAAGALELLLPVLLGAAAGWGAATLAFAVAGPSPQLDPAAVRSAAWSAALVALVSLIGNALVMLSQTHQIARSLSGRAPSRLGSPWLPLLTGATVLAVIATLTRERDQSYQDPLAALLPILVLACGCALIAQLAGALAGSVAAFRRPAGGRKAPPGVDRLVLRGLRRTGVAVTDLVVVLAIGIGVLAYGLLSASLVGEAVTDKSAVLAGAESSAQIRHSWLLGGGDGPTPRLPAGTAVVWRGSGVITPDNRAYDLLVVNPDTLPGAASWGSGPELARARAALSGFRTPGIGSPVPALLVGPSDRKAGSTARLQVGFKDQTVLISRRLDAFPGVVRPTLVLDARSYFPRLDQQDDPSHRIDGGLDFQGNFPTWIWSREGMPALGQLLAAHSLPMMQTLTLTEARATPVLTSGRWAASYQVVLGLAAAALAGLAVVVAVDRRVARAAPVDLMLSRFGVRPARLLALRTRELAVTGLAALAVLAGPLALMVLLLPRLIEPDPGLPPTMGVRVTALPLLLSAAAAVVVTAVAALAAARRSATLRPGEVLRDDT